METSNVIIGGLNADELMGIGLLIIAVLGLLLSGVSGGETDDKDF